MRQYLHSNEKAKIRWQLINENDPLNIAYTGVPFVLLGRRRYQCHQGQDYNKKKKEKRNEEKRNQMITDHYYHQSSRKLPQDTKKKNCPVVFNTKKLFTFPKFAIQKDSRTNRDNAGRKLKEFFHGSGIDNPDDCILQYMVKFPVSGHMFHNTGQAAGIIEPLDDRIKDFLLKLIRGGCRRVRELESRSLDFVKDGGCGITNVEMYRSRFYPERRKIRNLITRVKLQTRFSKIDQENVKHLISKLCSSEVYFIPRNICKKLLVASTFINIFTFPKTLLTEKNKNSFLKIFSTYDCK